MLALEKKQSGGKLLLHSDLRGGGGGGVSRGNIARAGPGYRQVAEACECGNEPSGSVKCEEFLD